MDEKEAKRFVFKVFAQSAKPGEHSIKTLWKMYLDHKGIETLEAKFYKLFKVIAHDVFIAYSQQQEEQLSSSQESIPSPSKTSSGFSSPTKSPRISLLSVSPNKSKSDLDKDRVNSTASRSELPKKKAKDITFSDDENDNYEQEEQKSTEQDKKQKVVVTFDKMTNVERKENQPERDKVMSCSDEDDIEDISSQQVLGKEPFKSIDLSSDEDSDIQHVKPPFNKSIKGEKKSMIGKDNAEQESSVEQSDDVISSDESKDNRSSKNKVYKKKRKKDIRYKSLSRDDEHDTVDVSDDEHNTVDISDGDHNTDDVSDGDHNSRKNIGISDSNDDNVRNRSKNVDNSSSNSSDSDDEGKETLVKKTGMPILDPHVKIKKAVKNKIRKVKKRTVDKESNPKDDSIKLKNLKKYVRACNMRKNYKKLFAVCKSMKAKERLLEEVIRTDTGIEGRITLEKCKDFLRKKEEADEVADLDTSNIILQGRGRSRRDCTRPVVVAPITVPSPRSYRAKLFGNLKGIIDSEENDDDSSPIKAKRTLSLDHSRDENHCSDEGTTAKKRKCTGKNTDGNDKKKRMLYQNYNEGSRDGVSEGNNTKRQKFVMKIDSSDDD